MLPEELHLRAALRELGPGEDQVPRTLRAGTWILPRGICWQQGKVRNKTENKGHVFSISK